MRLHFYLVLILPVFVRFSSASLCDLDQFKQTTALQCKCTDDLVRSINISCDQNFYGFVNLEKERSFQVICKSDIGILDHLYDWLNKLNFVDISSIQIQNCNLNGQVVEKNFGLIFPHVKSFAIETNYSIDENIFNKVFPNLTRLHITWSIIEKHFQKGFKDELFRNLTNLQHLTINSQQSYLSLTNDMFAGTTNLESLSASLRFDKSLQSSEWGFQHLTKLKMLDLSFNGIKQLKENTFENQRHLEVLDLSHNQLSSLSEMLFVKNGNLNKVILENNSLTNFTLNVFQNNYLKSLDLSFNKFLDLQEIADGLFRNLKFLVNLNMSAMNTLTLPKGIFSNLLRIQTVDLRGNQLEVFDSSIFKGLFKLSHVYLQNNNLKYLDISKFPLNIEVLDLSNNKLPSFNFNWSQLSRRFSSINISSNNISILIFGNIYDLHRHNKRNCILDFQSNPLKRIEIKEVSSVSNFEIDINLNNNTLDCDCDIYNFTNLFNSLESSSFKIHNKYLMCRKEKRIFRFVEMDQTNLICQADKEICPENCNCTFIGGESREHRIECTEVSEFPTNLFPSSRESYENITLILANNQISHLPMKGEVNGFQNIINLDLRNNSINHVHVNNFPPNLMTLDLSSNLIQKVDILVIRLWEEAMNSRGFKMMFSNNPFECICSNCRFLCFLFQRRENISDANATRCADYEQQLIADISPDFICIMERLPYIITGLLVPLAIAILTTLFFKYKIEIKVWLFSHDLCLWYVSEEELDKDKKFDAFISYSHIDEDIVLKIHDHLESGDDPYKLCLHFRDWIPGEFIPNQIIKSVQESRRTVFVMSKSFIISVWSRLEFRTAHVAALNEGRTRVIVILCEDVGDIDSLDSELKAYLKTNTYIKWGDRWFWDKLKYALPHRKKNGCGWRSWRNNVVNIN